MKARTIRIGVVEVPIPRWAIPLFGIIAVLWLAVYAGAHAYAEWGAISSPAEMERTLRATIDEYGRHLGETPEREWVAYDDGRRGLLVLSVFEDSCLLVKRRVSPSAALQTRLFTDVSRDPLPQPSAPRVSLFDRFMPPVAAAGRCIEPHGGKFASWYGERKNGWVEVWRRWEDSCTAVQWFLPPDRWDTHEDGRPRLRWTNCVH